MKRRILVVDDDRGMVTTLSDILEMHGWDTLRAYDGAEAILLASTHEPDVVLMDVKMPRVDGVQALAEIKARRPQMRVVLMTAYAAQELLQAAQREGALRVLRKPVELPELFSLLEEAIRRARSVLVVDDDSAWRLTMRVALAEHGISATVARSLREALVLLEHDAPGAVLLDLKLDGIDARDGMVAIKEVSPAVLLILCSGFATELSEAVAHAPAGLVDAAFTKPVEVERLLELINGHAPG